MRFSLILRDAGLRSATSFLPFFLYSGFLFITHGSPAATGAPFPGRTTSAKSESAQQDPGQKQQTQGLPVSDGLGSQHLGEDGIPERHHHPAQQGNQQGDEQQKEESTMASSGITHRIEVLR